MIYIPAMCHEFTRGVARLNQASALVSTLKGRARLKTHTRSCSERRDEPERLEGFENERDFPSD